MEIIQKLVEQTGKWLVGGDSSTNVVISSRIRLARNIQGWPFTHQSDLNQRMKVINIAKRLLISKRIIKNSVFMDLEKYTNTERLFLVERHLISHEHSQKGKGRAVIINDSETISIMVNEEDHFRLQVIQPGLQLLSAWEILRKIDENMSKEINFAFSPLWGYLTACPTNLGTGMRASVMLHLPGLIITKRIEKVIKAVNQLGMTVRGLYGEGTKAVGDLFQISNQVTLGLSEENIIDNMERVSRQVVDYENDARKSLMIDSKEKIEDKIWRAYGTLKNTRMISSEEALSFFSQMRLGINLGIIKKVKIKHLNKMMLMIQPAHLQKIKKKVLDVKKRDILRADLIRKMIK